jgi:hypothetical protein
MCNAVGRVISNDHALRRLRSYRIGIRILYCTVSRQWVVIETCIINQGHSKWTHYNGHAYMDISQQCWTQYNEHAYMDVSHQCCHHYSAMEHNIMDMLIWTYLNSVVIITGDVVAQW